MSSQDHEDRVFEVVRRKVLWGEGREAVFDNLAANGFTGADAERLYREAMRERVAIIRAACGKRAALGVLAIVGGLITLGTLLGGASVGRVGGAAIGGGAVALLFGVWWLVDGVVGYALAARREGSVADEI